MAGILTDVVEGLGFRVQGIRDDTGIMVWGLRCRVQVEVTSFRVRV